jgi:hypothetical protein
MQAINTASNSVSEDTNNHLHLARLRVNHTVVHSGIFCYGESTGGYWQWDGRP